MEKEGRMRESSYGVTSLKPVTESQSGSTRAASPVFTLNDGAGTAASPSHCPHLPLPDPLGGGSTLGQSPPATTAAVAEMKRPLALRRPSSSIEFVG